MEDAIKLLRVEFPDYPYPKIHLTSKAAEKLLKLGSYLTSDKGTSTYLRTNLGREFLFDNSKITKGLGIQFRDLSQTFKETVEYFIRVGVLPEMRTCPLRPEKQLQEIVMKMMNPQTGVEVKDRKMHLKTFPSCFVGSEAVEWMVKNLPDVKHKVEAVHLGQSLLQHGRIRHVKQKHDFLDNQYLYEFTTSLP